MTGGNQGKKGEDRPVGSRGEVRRLPEERGRGTELKVWERELAFS